MLILEFMSGGTLNAFLGLDDWKETSPCCSPLCSNLPESPSTPMSRREPHTLAALVLDVACALAWLHARGLLHRDVKCTNVLLDARRAHAKVADFGLATTHHSSSSQTRAEGTTRYMAPEVPSAIGVCWTAACDVYSFGLLLYEVAYQVKAFSDYSIGLHALFAAVRGERPAQELPRSLPGEPTAELMCRCWHADPSERPPMVEVLEQIARVKKTAHSLSEAETKGSSMKHRTASGHASGHASGLVDELTGTHARGEANG